MSVLTPILSVETRTPLPVPGHHLPRFGSVGPENAGSLAFEVESLHDNAICEHQDDSINDRKERSNSDTIDEDDSQNSSQRYEEECTNH